MECLQSSAPTASFVHATQAPAQTQLGFCLLWHAGPASGTGFGTLASYIFGQGNKLNVRWVGGQMCAGGSCL
jgi:hypothetical protein